MSRKAFTLVEICIVVGILMILSLISLIHLVRARIQAYDSIAKRRLYAAAKSMESFWVENNYYPSDSDIDILVNSTPPYLKQNIFDGQPQTGYTFSITSNPTSYSMQATAQYCNKTGTKVYTITQGMVTTEENCTP